MNRPRPEKQTEGDEISALLQTSVVWTRTGDIHHPFAAQVDRHGWVVRLGEFPEEPLYTLIVDGVEIGSFDTWPATWQRPRT